MRYFLIFLLVTTSAYGRDFGQWTGSDPEIAAWYQSLRQPDNPSLSCCGVADAYWADSFEVGPNGEYVAIITDERDLPYRQKREVGTRIVVPNHKIKTDQGNPTGHGIVFLRPNSDDVYCYLAPGGV